MVIQLRQLGLAAYLKMHGVKLIKVENKTFFFESDRSEKEWRVDYHNSCCMKHDAMVCELRYHITKE